jgi:hypothetical protein
VNKSRAFACLFDLQAILLLKRRVLNLLLVVFLVNDLEIKGCLFKFHLFSEGVSFVCPVSVLEPKSSVGAGGRLYEHVPSRSPFFLLLFLLHCAQDSVVHLQLEVQSPLAFHTSVQLLIFQIFPHLLQGRCFVEVFGVKEKLADTSVFPEEGLRVVALKPLA